MKADELQDRYHDLRSELDAAYAAPVWDGSRIDRIAEQLLPLEKALAQLQSQPAAAVDRPPAG